MYLSNVVGLVIVLSSVPLFAAILRIPFAIIAPVIVVVCAVGAYTVNNAMFNIWVMLAFGILGYVFKKLDYPLAPMILALVLGDATEVSFRQAILGSQGALSVFFSNWLVSAMMTAGLLLLFWPAIAIVLGKLRGVPSK
jgi:putative tricarboxylic transport membrane protein